MSNVRLFELDFDGRKLVVETGEVAKQAAGAAIIRYNDTAVLSVCAIAKKPTQANFFPLMVLYQEKMYAAGKIPGGFLKREGRPSDNETLTSRLIDRPIRPLFPKGFKYELQVINQVMSANTDFSPEMTAMFGSSLALGISDIPFEGPIAGVNVGRIDGKFIVNPTVEQTMLSDIELSIAGTEDAINMVESSAKEVSEEDMLQAIMFGHEWIKKLVAFQKEIIAEVGKPTGDYVIKEIDSELEAAVTDLVGKELLEAVRIEEKLARGEATATLTDKAVAHFEEMNKAMEKDALNELLEDVKNICSDIVQTEMRRLISEEKVRPDGRKLHELRPLESTRYGMI